jgi:hypothetical protein
MQAVGWMMGSVPSGSKEGMFSLYHCIQTDSGFHLASFPLHLITFPEVITLHRKIICNNNQGYLGDDHLKYTMFKNVGSDVCSNDIF